MSLLIFEERFILFDFAVSNMEEAAWRKPRESEGESRSSSWRRMNTFEADKLI